MVFKEFEDYYDVQKKVPVAGQSGLKREIEHACSICGSHEFETYNSEKARRCSNCGSVKRTRTIPKLFNENIPTDFSATKILYISPSKPERLFFKKIGATVTTVDIRPECKVDIVADICDMPEIASESFDMVFANCVFNHVYDDAIVWLRTDKNYDIMEFTKGSRIGFFTEVSEKNGNVCCQIEYYDENHVKLDFLKKMPHNYFDLIIVNDVFEHVYDTVQLLSNLAEVANDHCAIYFVIPNGNDLRFIAKEGHSGHCGISHFGFHVVDFINYPGHIGLPEIKERITCEYEITKQTIAQNEPNFPKAYASKLRSALKGFENQMQYDLGPLDAPKLAWKYLTKFWSGFAQRQALGLEPPSQTTERRFDSDEDDFGVRFVLSRKENLLSIDVVTEFPSEGLDFAFHLMRRGESIERSHYQQQPRYEWSLEAPGMYSAAIYVKRKEQEHKDYRILTQPLYFAGKVL